jgi:hypothetical protein
MVSAKSVNLNDDEYDMAASILRVIKPELDDVDIVVGYSDAVKTVSGIEYETSVSAVVVWCKLTQRSIDELVLVALSKELAQIVANIDADDSIVDFFGWLLVAKIHDINVKNTLNILNNRIYDVNELIW